MSDLETHPAVLDCHASTAHDRVLTARKVWLGRSTEVARILPDRVVRMIGAWCFLDHYGPEDISGTPGMQVWAHPHTGLQTVSYLLAGAIDHRDSLGTRARVRPDELHIMTAGRGIVHSELSPSDHGGGRPAELHGLQLWVALPEEHRHTAPAFRSYLQLPELSAPGVTGAVIIGTVAGVRAEAAGFTPLCAAELRLAPGTTYALPLARGFEHGLLVIEGTARIDDQDLERDQLRYTEPGRDTTVISTGPGCRLLLIGGEPFTEDIVMWWNFVGRSHEEIVAFRQQWLDRADRFPPVVDRSERVLEVPALPNVRMRPRPAQEPGRPADPPR